MNKIKFYHPEFLSLLLRDEIEIKTKYFVAKKSASSGWDGLSSIFLHKPVHILSASRDGNAICMNLHKLRSKPVHYNIKPPISRYNMMVYLINFNILLHPYACKLKY